MKNIFFQLKLTKIYYMLLFNAPGRYFKGIYIYKLELILKHFKIFIIDHNLKNIYTMKIILVHTLGDNI